MRSASLKSTSTSSRMNRANLRGAPISELAPAKSDGVKEDEEIDARVAAIS